MKRVIPDELLSRFSSVLWRLIAHVDVRDAQAGLRGKQRVGDLIALFAAERQATTIHTIWTQLRYWADWLDLQASRETPIGLRMIQAHLNSLEEKQARPAAILVRINVLRTICGKLDWLGPSVRRLLADTRLRLNERRAAERLEELPYDFLERLENATDQNRLIELRNTALVRLIADTALWPRAILGRRICGQDVRPRVLVQHLSRRPDGTGTLSMGADRGSGGTVFVPRSSMFWLDKWLSGSGLTRGPLFSSLSSRGRHQPLGFGQLSRILIDVRAKTGVRTRVTVAGLRRLTARRMQKLGIPMDEVRRAFRGCEYPVEPWIAVGPSRRDGNAVMRDFHGRWGFDFEEKRRQLDLFGADLTGGERPGGACASTASPRHGVGLRRRRTP